MVGDESEGGGIESNGSGKGTHINACHVQIHRSASGEGEDVRISFCDR